LKEHNEKRSTWTKSGVPWELIYYEACKNETDARSREAYLKTGMGKRYLRNRLKRFLSLTG
jgi:putative endonuclease